MSSTPLWVPLVVAALGLVSTLAAVVVTQIMANRRERTTWTRELEREQARWSREDQALTFEHRRTAYVEYYEALRRMSLRVYNHGMGLSGDDDAEGSELPWAWQEEAAEAVRRLEVYASPEVAKAAIDAYDATYQWGAAARYGRDNEYFYDMQERADVKQVELLEAMRSDLHVKGRPDYWF